MLLNEERRIFWGVRMSNDDSERFENSSDAPGGSILFVRYQYYVITLQ